MRVEVSPTENRGERGLCGDGGEVGSVSGEAVDAFCVFEYSS